MTISPQTIAKLADGVSFLFNAGFRDVVADLAVGESVHWDARHLNILHLDGNQQRGQVK